MLFLLQISSDGLDHLPRCFRVVDVYNSIRDAANLPPIIDGRHSLMSQERWEGSVLASIVAFFFAIWNVRSMQRRGVHFHSFIELTDLVLVSLQCLWLVRCCPSRSRKQRRQDRFCPPLPTPGVTIYRSDWCMSGSRHHCRNTCRMGCCCVVGRCSWFGCWHGFRYCTWFPW